MSMNTARTVAKIIALILVAALVITSFSFVFFLGTGNGAVYAATTTDRQYIDEELEYLKLLMLDVNENYKDAIEFKTLVDGAFQGVIDSLDDPYSVYYPSVETAEEFIDSFNGEFSGIGIYMEDYNGRVRIVSAIPGTPAERAGILPGDIIVKIDGANVAGLTLDEVANKVKGPAGTKVELGVERDGAIVSFSIIRETVKLQTVNFKMLEQTIGYIQITQFNKNTHLEFKNAKLQLIASGATSFLVDIRNNPGGFTSSASDIASQLMPKGPIMHFIQQGKVVETIYAGGEGDLKMPVVLLVNEGSASSSEILAGAWQDSKTAVLVGVTTFGKGIAQEVTELENGGGLKLSAFYFQTPNNNVINHIGITPDYVVKNIQSEGGELVKKAYNSFVPMLEKVKPKAGDVGLNVYGAQQRLGLLGYKVEINGTMDPAMVLAVRAFQKQAGLYVYGVLDYTTMNAIDREAGIFATGTKAGEDLQLKKAIEILSK